jgi:hypothetical protein
VSHGLTPGRLLACLLPRLRSARSRPGRPRLYPHAPMLRIDTRDIAKLERILRAVRTKAIPYANRNALNDMAFAARKQWRTEMERSFILRNRWTVGSIRVVKARGTDVSTMHSVIGSVSSYLGRQEFGGISHEQAIPTAPAAGQAKGLVPRTRAVRAQNRLAQRIGKGRGRTRRQGKYRLVYLETDQAKGVFRVWGRGKKGGRVLLWDLGHPTVMNPRIETLGPTVETVGRRGPRYYMRSLLREVRRAGWR